MEYIIVQAGGKGSRLGYLTRNKPKALVPVENLPMLFHLFRKYPDKRFIIIGDYRADVLREYLSVFAGVKYILINAEGRGTCAGINQALSCIPEDKSFMLVWSDLILPGDFVLPKDYQKGERAQRDYIGISQTFPCRWKYENGILEEECSIDYGVAGLFLFTDKSKLKLVPKSGELVRWLKENGGTYGTVELGGTREFGILEEYQKLEAEKCRPFNKITIEKDVITKEAVDVQGEGLAKQECEWYAKALEKKVTAIPQIYEKNPLRMERIKGRNLYECDNLQYHEKKEILKRIISVLKEIHQSQQVSVDVFSIREAYYKKTMERLSKIEDMVPFARDREIVINGRSCRNVYYYKRELEERLEILERNCSTFCFIHGDCTFSNLMLRENGEPVLIDPRGYFGHTKIYGDARYDWAKLYYSIAGNYDQFNLKRFQLEINKTDVRLEIDSNCWEDMEQEFFELTGMDEYEIRLLHAIIWLSLTTYAWQDYDSVCGAFYNGLYYLEEVL